MFRNNFRLRGDLWHMVFLIQFQTSTKCPERLPCSFGGFLVERLLVSGLTFCCRIAILKINRPSSV